jgi:predicted HicB family RNase H-like nuclease
VNPEVSSFVSTTSQSYGGNKMSQLYVRLPEDIHSKLRVIAALRNESLNSTMITASSRYVEDWEQKHGGLPTPPEEE